MQLTCIHPEGDGMSVAVACEDRKRGSRMAKNIFNNTVVNCRNSFGNTIVISELGSAIVVLGRCIPRLPLGRAVTLPLLLPMYRDRQEGFVIGTVCSRSSRAQPSGLLNQSADLARARHSPQRLLSPTHPTSGNYVYTENSLWRITGRRVPGWS